MSDTKTPEELVEEFNEKGRTTPFGCSLGEVKDGDSSPPSPPALSPSSNPPIIGSLPLDVPDGLDIKDPVELLTILDENILSGKTKLHDWQIKFMLDFARLDHTKEKPFQAVVQACNSSGKDKYIIAACAVWICMRYAQVECPITSSSGNQLDNQTGAHIDRLCHKANAVFGPFWKITYRYYEFKHVGKLGEPLPSKMILFATDEPGKAEGFHPSDAGKKMAIFTSETKSIPEDITSAIERCTGFTHRVDVSSPGLPAGYFYNTCISAIPREDIKDIKSLNSTQVLKYKVTAYQCSHITHSEIERIAAKLPGGKNNPVFKSSVLAEFGSTDEMVVIPSAFVWRAVDNKVGWIQEEYNSAGLDLSDGGAENVLVVRNGNKVIGLEAFRFDDTEDTIDYLQEKFKQYDLTSKYAKIKGDYCGLGGPMLRSLRRKGWTNVVFVDSRNKAANPKTYANRGTELFFNTRQLFENEELIIPNDKLLISQLSTRYYKITANNIHQLLSKLEQRSKGFPSPDRADALNLCFWDYKSTKIDEEGNPLITDEEKERAEEEKNKVTPDFDMKSWASREIKKNQPEHIKEDNLDDLLDDISNYNKQQKQNKINLTYA